jgi:CRP/FNR family transcriptional regulator, cyclic AMP receptor protein
MIAPYGLELVESCSGCAHRAGRLFCDLDDVALAALDALRFASAYPKGALLFVEGQTPRGVYLLCAGRVKLSTSASDAHTLITQIAEPGDLLGLSAVLAGAPYEVTAETLDSCYVNFIRREDFLLFLATHGNACLRAARQLSYDYHAALAQTRLLGLSHSAAAKFARFILDACAQQGQANGYGHSMKLTLTHEEIGQLIGASRETVTRLFSAFKHERLIQLKGATLIVRDEPALVLLANG